MNIKENIIYVTFFSFIITFIFVFILAFVNEKVKDKIKINSELFEIKSVLNAMNIEFKDDNNAYDIYKNKIVKKIISGNTIYTFNKENNEVHALLFSGKGLWGTITGVIGINNDFTRITGIDFISQSETPGLGGRIDEKWFKDQFYNKKIFSGGLIFNYSSGGKGNYDKEANQIDSISGATITSKSLEKMINRSLSDSKNNISIKTERREK